MAYHVPVLLAESLDGLNIKPDGVYADLTFGGGGHSRAILERLGRRGHLFAFDQDEDALNNAIDDVRFSLIRGNFKYFRNFLRYRGVSRVDGILADLGVSSHHLDCPERGFSFRFEGPLDMRMNQKSRLSAAEVVNKYTVEDLTRILKLYGEISDARRFAVRICTERKGRSLSTVDDLAELLRPIIPAKIQNKTLAQVFQAVRIEVNHELDALKLMLLNADKSLATDGRLVVISYHSLEDRLVKNYFRAGNFEGDEHKDPITGQTANLVFEQLNRKVITPNASELEENNRSRSAKLRIGRKL